MNERMQKVLDGDLDRDDLTFGEQAALREAESAISAVLRAIPASPLPDLSPAVLRRIREREGKHAVTVPDARREASLTEWLWRRRSISFSWRPAWALAAAVMLAVLLATQSLTPDRAALPGTRQVFTQFLLRAPGAKNVALAGDFSAWQPAYAMTRSEPGVWMVVVPLEPGIHSYSFVVDGAQWVPDPEAPAFDDGFGGRNSRVAVLTPDEASR